MKHVSVLGLALTLFGIGASSLIGCGQAENAAREIPLMSAEEEKVALHRADPAGAYGQALVAEAVVSISDLVTNPAAHEGETVRIKGVVEEVCPMRGCWLDIADSSGKTMRVKVTDGQIVFPVSAKGHEAAVEGTLLKVEYDAEQAMAYRAHQAEELGQAFDPNTAEQGPMVIWQLDGKGAVIGD